MEAGREEGAQADEKGVHAKAQTKLEGIEPVVVLEKEGRGGDVGKEGEEAAHDGERAEREPLVVKDAEEIGIRRGQWLAAAPGGGQRLAETETAEGEDDAKRHEQAEDALPVDEVGEHAAEHRREHRHDTIDGAEDGEEVGELTPLIHVGGDALGQHHAACSRDALQHTHDIEDGDGRREYAAQGGKGKQDHREHEQPLAPVFVGQGADEDLPRAESDHAGGERRGDRRRRTEETAGHLGQEGQIKVGDKGTEGCEHAQNKGDE